MKLLLHIGTHKKATSSLQSFLRAHRKLMQSHGIYYPIPPDAKKILTQLLQTYQRGWWKRPETYLKRHAKQPTTKDAILLLSVQRPFMQ